MSDDDASTALKIARARKHAVQKLLRSQDGKGIADSSDACKQLREEVQRLKEDLSEKDFEVRELKYAVAQHEKKNAELVESSRLTDVKYKALVINLQKSLDAFESKLASNARIVNTESELILQLLEALERHTMNGKHSVGSYVFVQLFSNLRSRVQNLNRFDIDKIMLGMPPPAPSAIDRNITSSVPSIGTSSHNEPVAVTASNNNATNSKLNNVEQTLLEMCQKLEEENSSLQNEVKKLNEEVSVTRKENAATTLIPHYRLAILRERSTVSTLQQSLTQSNEQVVRLKEQFEKCYHELEKATSELQQQKLLVHRLQTEKQLFENEIKPLLQATSMTTIPPSQQSAQISTSSTALNAGSQQHQLKHPSSAVEHYRQINNSSHTATLVPEYNPVATTASATSLSGALNSTSSGSSSSSSSSSIHATLASHQVDDKVISIQHEISELDVDIGRLKEQLKLAALQQTQKIVSDVLMSTRNDTTTGI